MRNGSKGFTLIELLVVIAIIAILAAILFPVIGQVKEKSRMTNSVSNLRQIWAGMSMYRTDYGYLPPFLASLYPNYVKSNKAFICKSDPYKGRSPFLAADWENGYGFKTVWKMEKMGCSYPYIPRAEFWYKTPAGKKALWEGKWAPTNFDWVDSTTWIPVHDHWAPVIFEWWHAQNRADPTITIDGPDKKRASVLVLILGGSVLRCEHERMLPCMGQMGNAKHPREVLH